jgi:hypothetical protein
VASTTNSPVPSWSEAAASIGTTCGSDATLADIVRKECGTGSKAITFPAAPTDVARCRVDSPRWAPTS